MADSEPLLGHLGEIPAAYDKPPRVASLDIFRGLCVFLMILVDYGASVFPIIAHSPWNGLHLADFIMPFFLFIAGVSLALTYKRVPKRGEATWQAMLRAAKLFVLGVVLQGGYFHGINSLSYGVDIGRIRWLGILQRISIGYIVAALCEIWLTRRKSGEPGVFKSFIWHWCVAFSLLAIYLGLFYGLYVPDWQFEAPSLTAFSSSSNDTHVYMVKCSARGDVGPACNAAAMIDRYVLGVDHLYAKPVYRNLKECNVSSSGQVPKNSPSWCHAPFDPEGLLSSLPAAVTCIIGLQYGHVLAHIQEHKLRLNKFSLFSVAFFVLGLFAASIGMAPNKSLYTLSYMLITSASAGLTFSAVYFWVDVLGYRLVTSVFDWIGKRALILFILIPSNLSIVAIQGFYWSTPKNNIVHWVVSQFDRG